MSLKLIKNNDKARFVCIVLVFVATVLFFENIGLFEGINNYCYDLAFRLRGERKHDDRIIIAAIDEKTHAQLGRWPIRRSYYADLLDFFSQAETVGINIIFSEPSDDDALLSRAITRHAKVVLPVYIDREFNISYPVKILSPAGFGHVHIEQGVDGFVREVFHTISNQSASIPSFASALYAVINGRKNFAPETRNKIPKQKIYDKIIQSDHMRINFYDAPGVFQTISVVEILNGQWSPSFFANKIVLVGKTSAGLDEGLLVPFTNDRNRMPGVEFHAQILNNLLDKKNIRSIEPWVRWAITIVLAIFCFFMFIKFRGLSGTLFAFLSLLTISFVTLFLFATFNLWIFPASLYFSVAVVFPLAYIFILNLEIANRMGNEKKLMEQQEKLRSLSSKLLLTEERERRRIATELHDRIGQTLAVSKIKLGEVQQALASNEAAKELDEIRHYIEQTIQDTRSLTFELSPPVLYELGLEAALAWLATQIQGKHSIRIIVKNNGQSKHLEDSLRVVLFQATRELLFNVVKHARAQSAGVSIQKDDDTIRIKVEDDGVGFDTAELEAIKSGCIGFGLFNIRERLNPLGGNLAIKSEPGAGSRFTIALPLSCKIEIKGN